MQGKELKEQEVGPLTKILLALIIALAVYLAVWGFPPVSAEAGPTRVGLAPI